MTRILKDLSKNSLGFGGASISGEGAGYGFGDISSSNAINLLNFVFDRGITVFDTAPIYGFGESEIRIGEAFKNKREKVHITSKSGVSWHSTKRVNMTNDPKETEKMLHESLTRLQSEYIDLYMIHWPDKRVDIRRPMEVLSKAKSQGKIKSIGLCNTNIEEFEKASEVDLVEVVQGELNLFERASLESVISLCQEKDLSFMSWGTLDKGILTGRVTKDRKFDKSDCRSWAPWWKAMDKSSKFSKMKSLLKYLETIEKSPLSMALSYNSSVSHVDSILCGGRSISQWEGLLTASTNLLNEIELLEVQKIINEN